MASGSLLKSSGTLGEQASGRLPEAKSKPPTSKPPTPTVPIIDAAQIVDWLSGACGSIGSGPGSLRLGMPGFRAYPGFGRTRAKDSGTWVYPGPLCSQDPGTPLTRVDSHASGQRYGIAERTQ